MKRNSRLTRYKTPLERLFCLRKFQVHSSLLSFCSSQNITQGATNNLPGWLLRLRLHWRYGSAKVSWAWSLQVTQSNSAVGKRPMPPMPPIFFQKKLPETYGPHKMKILSESVFITWKLLPFVTHRDMMEPDTKIVLNRWRPETTGSCFLSGNAGQGRTRHLEPRNTSNPQTAQTVRVWT